MFPLGYNLPLWWATFHVATYIEVAIDCSGACGYDDMMHIRAWLLIEIMYHFNWLLMSVLFIASAYIIKFKPISKDERALALDDDIWNDKVRDDFLHYLKFEYFLFTLLLT